MLCSKHFHLIVRMSKGDKFKAQHSNMSSLKIEDECHHQLDTVIVARYVSHICVHTFSLNVTKQVGYILCNIKKCNSMKVKLNGKVMKFSRVLCEKYFLTSACLLPTFELHKTWKHWKFLNGLHFYLPRKHFLVRCWTTQGRYDQWKDVSIKPLPILKIHMPRRTILFISAINLFIVYRNVVIHHASASYPWVPCKVKKCFVFKTIGTTYIA